MNRSFLLVRELGGANVAASQLDIEHALHGAEHLLVGGGATSLEFGDDSLGGVAAGSEILLGHLGLDLLSGLCNDVANSLADGVGLDDVVGTVNLGHTLTLRCGTLCKVLVGACSVYVWICCTYGVGRRVLLLSGETSSSLGSVESSLSSDDSLSLSIAGATSAAADLGLGIPVIHFEVCDVVWKV
jgi:hypothetical protein